MALGFISGFMVSSLVEELIDKIKANAIDAVGLAFSYDAEQELKNLELSYVNAHSLFNSVDGLQLVSSERHREWIAEIKRVCYEIEDFIESVKIDIFEKKGEARIIASYWRKWNMSFEICRLKKMLDSVTSSSDQFLATRGVSDNGSVTVNKEPLNLPYVDCFNRDKEGIILQLLHPGRSTIIVICGIFGVGKTTLANAIKNDARVQNYFDYRLWVSVSGEFHLLKVLGSSIVDLQFEKSYQGNSRLSPYTDQQHVRLFRELCKDRKILIVLDDIWAFGKEWDEFHAILLDTPCQFGVLITSRNPTVAYTITSLSSITTATYFLPLWSDNDCAAIIRQQAVISAGHKRRKISEAVSVQIAKKFCNGLPLVANIIGRLLNMEGDYIWLMNLPNLWTIPVFKEHIFLALRLNYSQPSDFVRSILPYFSLFPKEHVYKKAEMITLWLCEAFVTSQGSEFQGCLDYQVLEMIGSNYFEHILSKSILYIYNPTDKVPQTYQMHEFVHQYARLIGRDLYVQVDEEFVAAYTPGTLNGSSTSGVIANMRHLSLLCPTIPALLWKYIERYAQGLRTIIALQEHIQIGKLSHSLFCKLPSLRVLNMSGSDLSELPESLGRLKHLRLLDVSRTRIKKLPESTANLSMLLFLKAEHCPLLLRLPNEISNLIHLRHLEVDVHNLRCMPPNIGRLTNLCSLPAFIVGIKEGDGITELKNLIHLKGSICLMNLENVKVSDTKEEVLRNKPCLKRLVLEWNRSIAIANESKETNQSKETYQSKETLSCLIPHDNLEELQVIGYNDREFPKWISSDERSLTSIHLLRCELCTSLPALGKLQHLKFLVIEELHSIENIDDQFLGGAAGFPSLEVLKLQDMMCLESWERLQANQMACLRELDIASCPKLSVLPSLHQLCSLQKVQISYCPALKALPEEGFGSSMDTLIIVESNLLKDRCLPGQADWDIVKAIPNVLIDCERIAEN